MDCALFRTRVCQLSTYDEVQSRLFVRPAIIGKVMATGHGKQYRRRVDAMKLETIEAFVDMFCVRQQAILFVLCGIGSCVSAPSSVLARF